MGEKYILAIDGGTQSTKVGIFDLQGNLVCECKEPLRPTESPQFGWVEHPDDDLWDSLKVASKKLMEKFSGKPEDIIGVGLCTIRTCRVYMKADGNLSYPVLDWMDMRAYGPFDFWPEGTAYATTTTGYMTHRLTGERKDTAANYNHNQWPVDPATWRYSDDEKVYEFFKIKREMLFDQYDPGEVLGVVSQQASDATGIPAGIPVVSTASDKAVEALGGGLISPGDVALASLGTYIPAMVAGEKPLDATYNMYTNPASMPGRYLYECNGIWRGMWLVSWFKDLMGDEVALKAKAEGISPEQLMDREAAEVPAGSHGLMTVPEWLGGPTAPYKRGMMIGFDSRHKRPQIFRSILEGIALTVYNNFMRMQPEVGADPKRIIVSGGGSSSDVFMQIFADVFGIPAVRNKVNNAAGLGSAICVAVATGVYDSFETAVHNMVHVDKTFQPIADNVAVYKRLNEEVYRDLTKATDPLLQKTHEIFEGKA